MKKLLFTLVTLLIVTGSFANVFTDVDEDLRRSFNSSFPNAQKVTWEELDHAYVVAFVENGVRTRIMYLRDGTIVHFLRYYGEQQLPFHVRLSIKYKFPDKTIYGVVEEYTLINPEQLPSTTFHVKLEDATSWTTVKLERNGSWKVTENFQKLD